MKRAHELCRRHFMAYGIWECDGGREVLFNRFYNAIWERWNSGIATAADPSKWVTYHTQKLLYLDSTPEIQKQRVACAVMAEWGCLPEKFLVPRVKKGRNRGKLDFPPVHHPREPKPDSEEIIRRAPSTLAAMPPS